MPEGDTIFRTATVLRRALVGEEVTDARGRPGGAQVERVVGSRVQAVRSLGKHLLIDFDAGLTLHTHLGMHGSWHRYRPGERWRRAADGAVALIRTARVEAVCFEAPTAELIETRALGLHPALAHLGPDLLADPPDIEGALARLRQRAGPESTIAEALLDQRAVAGIGNVYRSEVLWAVSVWPFALVHDLDDDRLRRVVETAASLLRANLDGGARVTSQGATGRAGRKLNVYGHAGRPCPRCGALILARRLGQPPRRLFWCPGCQHEEWRRAAPRWTVTTPPTRASVNTPRSSSRSTTP